MINSLTFERSAELEREFEVLLALMEEMITSHATASRGKTAPTLAIDLHVLSMKLFKHLCSARTLLEPCPFGTETLPSFSYIDHSSVSALTRTAVENYLVMHWLHSDGDESLQDFRHTVWTYCGWKKRSKMIPTIEEVMVRHQEAVTLTAELLPVMVGSPHFQKYSSNEQKALRKGNWTIATRWHVLAEDAGMNGTYFSMIYPYLSGHTHSDFISSLQSGQARDLTIQYTLALNALQVCLMVMGHFVHFYADLFPAAMEVLQRPGESQEYATKWYIKAEDMAYLYEKVGHADAS